jgi:hypothetical protein
LSGESRILTTCLLAVLNAVGYPVLVPEPRSRDIHSKAFSHILRISGSPQKNVFSGNPKLREPGFANFYHHVLGSELGTLHLLLYPLLLVYGLRQIGIWVDELYDLVRLARTIDQLSLK